MEWSWIDANLASTLDPAEWTRDLVDRPVSPSPPSPPLPPGVGVGGGEAATTPVSDGSGGGSKGGSVPTFWTAQDPHPQPPPPEKGIDGDEILVVANLPTTAPQRWSQVASPRPSSWTAQGTTYGLSRGSHRSRGKTTRSPSRQRATTTITTPRRRPKEHRDQEGGSVRPRWIEDLVKQMKRNAKRRHKRTLKTIKGPQRKIPPIQHAQKGPTRRSSDVETASSPFPHLVQF